MDLINSLKKFVEEYGWFIELFGFATAICGTIAGIYKLIKWLTDEKRKIHWKKVLPAVMIVIACLFVIVAATLNIASHFGSGKGEIVESVSSGDIAVVSGEDPEDTFVDDTVDSDGEPQTPANGTTSPRISRKSDTKSTTDAHNNTTASTRKGETTTTKKGTTTTTKIGTTTTTQKGTKTTTKKGTKTTTKKGATTTTSTTKSTTTTTSDPVIKTGMCGDNVSFKLYDSGLMEIDGSGWMNDGQPVINEYVKFINTIKFKGNITYTGQRSFFHFENLTSVSLPNSLTAIGKQSFEGCKSLHNIIIPSSVSFIGGEAFAGCTSLQKIVLPNSLKAINWEVFSCCTSLRSITIPASVTWIDDDAFFKCNNLSDVYYKGSEAQWNSISGHDNIPDNATIHYNS